jgi:single-stranded-DNA-specific exonuclease
LSHSRWNLLPSLKEQAAGTLSTSPLLARLLHNRGIIEESQVVSFLRADESLSGDPNLLPGMQQAAARLYQALLSNEKIAVYGDFDADGITSTALLVQGLSLLECKAIPYIPHRLNEGYGLNVTALENLKRQDISLVVTVDCGITAVAEVDQARRMGLDIIITDHHIPSDKLPDARAIVNPKLPGSRYPFSDLAGVGVALKLLQALFRGMGKERQLIELTDLVALGTVADMVPILGENRYLVKNGLERLRTSPRIGIRELLSQAGSSPDRLDAGSISWIVAPRLNAAGRLEHAMGSYRLLTTDSLTEARELASWLEGVNAERQKLTAKIFMEAREQVLTQLDAPVLIVGGNEFPAGIIGLVAGRLTEEFYRPAIVLRTGEQFCGGSCRSIPEFNIIQALGQCRDLLTHFGGHARAAGLSLKTKDLPRLREELTGLASVELSGIDLRPRIDVDAEVKFSQMGGKTWDDIQKLAPFGQGNPLPTFLSRSVSVMDCRMMGNGGDHLRFKLKQGSSLFDAVGFDLGKYRSEVSGAIDIVFNLELDRWNGQDRLRLNIIDFEKSQ